MNASVVVDIGNSRVKWGRVAANAITDPVSLPADDPSAWQVQLDRWGLREPASWLLAGVNPERQDRLAAWLRDRGQRVAVLDDWRFLPLKVRLEYPERAGIDRLLIAVAANARREPGTPAVVVGAGTAVTVDWLDADGAFCGGAILPGFHMMARALHEHTALLPVVEIPAAPPAMPGDSTPAAMQAGVFWSVAGGVRAIIDRMIERTQQTPHVFLTGGDAELLDQAMRVDGRSLKWAPIVWPWMTLEGIRLSGREPLPADS
jgi:type III pantothenate kinase